MLTKRNNNRKDEEKVMLGEALKQASDAYYGEGRRGLVLFLPEGNHGIHGIVASRIKERFNCPTIIFSPQNLKDSPSGNRLLSGSGRSVDNIEIDSILSEIQKDIKFKFGGHTMALGAKLEQSKLEKFSLLFDQKVKEQSTRKGFDDSFFFPFVKIDHILQDDDLKWLRGLDILSELNSLDPFGQRFEQPCFGLNVRVMSFTLIGANKNHVRIKFQDTSGGQHEAMFFNYTTSPIYGTLKIGESYTFAVDLQYNDFYKRLGMIIQAALSYPRTVEALGHNVPLIFMGVFGVGTALAGVAGVIAGPVLGTFPYLLSVNLDDVVFLGKPLRRVGR